jgi:BESS motif
VQQRWKTARDAYIRCKATLNNMPSGSGAKKRKKYVYFECMQFLENKRELNTEDSIVSNEEPNQTAGNEEAFEPQGNQGTVVEGNQGTVEPQPSTSNINSQIPASSGRKFTRTRKKYNYEDEFDKEMLSLFKDNAKKMENDDMAFFCSLLPITKNFSTEQKLIFRRDVLQKALDISRLDPDRPGTSNSFVSSDSNSVTYPATLSFQTLPVQSYLVEEPSNIEQYNI